MLFTHWKQNNVYVHDENVFKINIEIFDAELYFTIDSKIVIYAIYNASFNSHNCLYNIRVQYQPVVYFIFSITYLTS